MRPSFVPGALAAAALLVYAGSAAAQACLGLPTRDGQITLAGTAADLDDDTRFGVEFTADVSGPAAFGFAYDGAGTDGDRQLFMARVSYDFFLIEPAVCGVAGVLYDDAPAAGIDDRLGVPVGIGIGKTLPAESFSATLYAVPQYVWLRESLVADAEDDTRTSNEFMAELGLNLRFRPVYVGGGVVVDTFDDSDPAFRIRAGLIF
jgi:hypothetical protein